jgi:hypothetical protein
MSIPWEIKKMSEEEMKETIREIGAQNARKNAAKRMVSMEAKEKFTIPCDAFMFSSLQSIVSRINKANPDKRFKAIRGEGEYWVCRLI